MLRRIKVKEGALGMAASMGAHTVFGTPMKAYEGAKQTASLASELSGFRKDKEDNRRRRGLKRRGNRYDNPLGKNSPTENARYSIESSYRLSNLLEALLSKSFQNSVKYKKMAGGFAKANAAGASPAKPNAMSMVSNTFKDKVRRKRLKTNLRNLINVN